MLVKVPTENCRLTSDKEIAIVNNNDSHGQ